MNIIFSDGKPPWQVKEEYRKVNRSKEDVLIVEAGPETSEVRFMYPDFVPYIYEGKDSLLYNKVTDNDRTFKIGSLELEYIREDTNSSWRNARSVELPLLKWFAEKYNNNVVELGAVSNQYSFFKGWDIVDPYDHYPLSIRKDILEYDYTDKNLLSCSTIEHCGVDLGYNQKEDKYLAVRGLEKIVKESKNYLITFPVGANYYLQDYVMNSNLPYVILTRNNIRGETNNWKEDNNKDNFYLPYFHFEYYCGYFGCAACIIILTNQQEIF
ncbi:MAG: hypothetical protein Q8P20_01995 [bacterium]|nr:hypothetical protein [bacterium]